MSAKKTSLILPFLLAPAISLAAPAVLVVDYQKAVSSTPAVSSEAAKQKAAMDLVSKDPAATREALRAAFAEAREKTGAVADSRGRDQALDAISKIASSMGASAVIDKAHSVAYPPSLDITSRVGELLSDPSSERKLARGKPSKSVPLIVLDLLAVGEKCGSFKAAEELADRAISEDHDRIREASRAVSRLPESARAIPEKTIESQLASLEARRKAVFDQAVDDILLGPSETIVKAAAKSGAKGEPTLIVGPVVWASDSSDITTSVSDALCRGKAHPPIVADSAGAEGVVHANGQELRDSAAKASEALADKDELRLRERAERAGEALSSHEAVMIDKISKGRFEKGSEEACRDCQKRFELERNKSFAREDLILLSAARSIGMLRDAGVAEASARGSVVIDNSKLPVMGGASATESIIRRLTSSAKDPVNR